MKRLVRTAFEYKDYRTLLNEDFTIRSSQNTSYSLRAYARDLKVSASFLSEILGGKKHLTLAKAKSVFMGIGITDDQELSYLESLIISQVSKKSSEKTKALQDIAMRFRKPGFQYTSKENILLNSADHFIIHGITQTFQNEDEILKIAERMQIPPALTLQILAEFVANGQLSKNGEVYQNQENDIMVTKSDRLLTTQKQLVTRLIDLTTQAGGMTVPNRVGHYLTMGFTEKTLPQFWTAYTTFIKTINRLSHESEKAEHMGFFSSSFFSFKTEELLQSRPVASSPKKSENSKGEDPV